MDQYYGSSKFGNDYALFALILVVNGGSNGWPTTANNGQRARFGRPTRTLSSLGYLTANAQAGDRESLKTFHDGEASVVDSVPLDVLDRQFAWARTLGEL